MEGPLEPEELSSRLFRHTPSEEENLRGNAANVFEGRPKRVVNGIDSFVLSTERMDRMLDEVPSSPDIDTATLLHVKKTTRFQYHPMHVHNWIEFGYVFSGTCRQHVNDSTYDLIKGEVILIDTNVPHSIEPLGEDDIYLSLIVEKSYLNASFFNRLARKSILSEFFVNAINDSARHNSYIIFHSSDSHRVPLFFNELVCEILDPSLNSESIVDNLLSLIINELINVYRRDYFSETKEGGRFSILPVLAYIEKNYRDCTLESTAEHFAVNPNYLTTMLKEQTGQSFKPLVQTQRLNTAARLLSNSSISVEEVASRVGYANMSFFYRKFSDRFGMTPKEYRDQALISA